MILVPTVGRVSPEPAEGGGVHSKTGSRRQGGNHPCPLRATWRSPAALCPCCCLALQSSGAGLTGWRGWLGFGLSVLSMVSTVFYFISLQASRSMGFATLQLQASGPRALGASSCCTHAAFSWPRPARHTLLELSAKLVPVRVCVCVASHNACLPPRCPPLVNPPLCSAPHEQPAPHPCPPCPPAVPLPAFLHPAPAPPLAGDRRHRLDCPVQRVERPRLGGSGSHGLLRLCGRQLRAAARHLAAGSAHRCVQRQAPMCTDVGHAMASPCKARSFRAWAVLRSGARRQAGTCEVDGPGDVQTPPHTHRPQCPSMPPQ